MLASSASSDGMIGASGATGGAPSAGGSVLCVDASADGARVYSSFPAAINTARAIARRQGAHEVYVIGGAMIYEAALPYADRIYMTEVDATPEGDVYFPSLAGDEWTSTALESHDAGNGNDFAFTIIRMDHTTPLAQG